MIFILNSWKWEENSVRCTGQRVTHISLFVSLFHHRSIPSQVGSCWLCSNAELEAIFIKSRCDDCVLEAREPRTAGLDGLGRLQLLQRNNIFARHAQADSYVRRPHGFVGDLCKFPAFQTCVTFPGSARISISSMGLPDRAMKSAS